MKCLNYFAELLVSLCLLRLLYEPTPITASALLIAVLAYVHKTYQAGKKEIIEKEIQNHAEFFTVRLSEVQEELKEVKGQLDASKKVQTQLEKSAEEIKKVISTANLNALYTRTRK